MLPRKAASQEAAFLFLSQGTKFAILPPEHLKQRILESLNLEDTVT